MSTKSMAYDNATYVARNGESASEAGGAATTQYSKFVAFTNLLAFSAQVTVTTIGTATTHLLSVLKISGTATSTLATTTLGTAAVGTTTNVALSTAAGGVSLAQGDILSVITGADAAGKAAVAYEYGVVPGANVTA